MKFFDRPAQRTTPQQKYKKSGRCHLTAKGSYLYRVSPNAGTFRILEQTEFAGKVMIFNGTNTDPKSKQIYKEWVEKNKGMDRVSGSPTADMRAALVEYFRDEASILIATEATAEGINLQFCNMVVNYDLPWNPQRIEQRIGRCHRYGQKYDVVVVNFLIEKMLPTGVYTNCWMKNSVCSTVYSAPAMKCWVRFNRE